MELSVGNLSVEYVRNLMRSLLRLGRQHANYNQVISSTRATTVIDSTRVSIVAFQGLNCGPKVWPLNPSVGS